MMMLNEQQLLEAVKELTTTAITSGAAVAKDFRCDLHLLESLNRFLDTANIPITANVTAIGRDLIHVEISPEIKGGGAVA